MAEAGFGRIVAVTSPMAAEPDAGMSAYGVGKAAEETLQSQGIRVIAALIEETNEPSIRFFRRAGYEDMPHVRYLSKRSGDEV